MALYQLWASRLDGETFLLFTYIRLEDVAKITEVPRAPRYVNLARAITWLVGVTINFTILKLQSAYISPVFTRQNTFEKKLAGEMLIGQIIKFEWRGLGPHDRICTPATGYFYDKTKISKENFRVDYYLPLKYCRRLLLCFSLPAYLALPYLGHITSKIQPQNAKL